MFAAAQPGTEWSKGLKSLCLWPGSNGAARNTSAHGCGSAQARDQAGSKVYRVHFGARCVERTAAAAPSQMYQRGCRSSLMGICNPWHWQQASIPQLCVPGTMVASRRMKRKYPKASANTRLRAKAVKTTFAGRAPLSATTRLTMPDNTCCTKKKVTTASAVLNLNCGRTRVAPVSAVCHNRSACKRFTTGFIAGRLQAGTAN